MGNQLTQVYLKNGHKNGKRGHDYANEINSFKEYEKAITTYNSTDKEAKCL